MVAWRFRPRPGATRAASRFERGPAAGTRSHPRRPNLGGEVRARLDCALWAERLGLGDRRAADPRGMQRGQTGLGLPGTAGPCSRPALQLRPLRDAPMARADRGGGPLAARRLQPGDSCDGRGRSLGPDRGPRGRVPRRVRTPPRAHPLPRIVPTHLRGDPHGAGANLPGGGAAAHRGRLGRQLLRRARPRDGPGGGRAPAPISAAEPTRSRGDAGGSGEGSNPRQAGARGRAERRPDDPGDRLVRALGRARGGNPRRDLPRLVGRPAASAAAAGAAAAGARAAQSSATVPHPATSPSSTTTAGAWRRSASIRSASSATATGTGAGRPTSVTGSSCARRSRPGQRGSSTTRSTAPCREGCGRRSASPPGWSPRAARRSRSGRRGSTGGSASSPPAFTPPGRWPAAGSRRSGAIAASLGWLERSRSARCRAATRPRCSTGSLPDACVQEAAAADGIPGARSRAGAVEAQPPLGIIVAPGCTRGRIASGP